ncbi:hypothetical protein M0813_03285 [Anaeramoeba flamelloides]|uniref:BTB domain-containing protein n=1 Tax=Anaeramoeba flamelloides TaxID=1746091 RepID=A0ABQ8XZV9_9EUKA|nr:hypothetical protein M0813_03285 [Anaeramoeba flamelloides]
MFLAEKINKKIEYPFVFELESGGRFSGECSRICVNGVDYSPNSHGLNIVLVDPANSIISHRIAFNTEKSEASANNFVELIKSIPLGFYVLISAQGKVSNYIHTDQKKALIFLGSTNFNIREHEYALIGRRGARPGTALCKKGTSRKAIILSNVSDGYWEDLKSLQNDKTFTDFSLMGNQVHLPIIQTRIGEKNITKLIELLKNEENSVHESMIEWIYTRQVTTTLNSNRIKLIIEKLGLDYEKKSTIYQFIMDMYNLYKNNKKGNEKEKENENENDDLKDLIIKINENSGSESYSEPDSDEIFNSRSDTDSSSSDSESDDEYSQIKTHKFLVACRSEFFKKEILNNKDIKIINDKSGNFYETMSILNKYFYTDLIDFNLVSGDNINQCEKLQNYYLLNKKSNVDQYFRSTPQKNTRYKELLPDKAFYLNQEELSFNITYQKSRNELINIKVNDFTFSSKQQILHIVVVDTKNRLIANSA